MNVLDQAKLKSHKTDYQIFWLAYSTLNEEDEVVKQYAQAQHALFLRSGNIPPTVEMFCQDIMEGRRDV